MHEVDWGIIFLAGAGPLCHWIQPRFLEGNGVESPRLNAGWLLAHALNRPSLEPFLNGHREFSRVILGAF